MSFGILNNSFDNAVPRNFYIKPAFGNISERPLIGRMLGVTAAYGTLTTNIALAGNAVANVTAVSVIGYPIPLAGDALVSASVSGGFDTFARLAGNAIVTPLLIGDLENRAPVAGTVSSIQFTQGVPEDFDLSVYGYDPDGDELTMIFVPGPDGLPAGITFDAFTGILHYDGSDLGATEATPKVWADNRIIFEDRTDFGGYAGAQSEASGRLTSILALAGSATIQAEAGGLLSFPYDLFGVALVESSSETALTTTLMLQGVAGGVTSMAGHITDIMQLAGDATGNVQATGILYAQVVAITGSGASVCEALGTLTARVAFVGDAYCSASGLGRLGPDYIFFGDAHIVSEASAKLYTMGKDYPWEQEISTLNEWTKEQPL